MWCCFGIEGGSESGDVDSRGDDVDVDVDVGLLLLRGVVLCEAVVTLAVAPVTDVTDVTDVTGVAGVTHAMGAIGLDDVTVMAAFAVMLSRASTIDEPHGTKEEEGGGALALVLALSSSLASALALDLALSLFLSLASAAAAGADEEALGLSLLNNELTIGTRDDVVADAAATDVDADGDVAVEWHLHVCVTAAGRSCSCSCCWWCVEAETDAEDDEAGRCVAFCVLRSNTMRIMHITLTENLVKRVIFTSVLPLVLKIPLAEVSSITITGVPNRALRPRMRISKPVYSTNAPQSPNCMEIGLEGEVDL